MKKLLSGKTGVARVNIVLVPYTSSLRCREAGPDQKQVTQATQATAWRGGRKFNKWMGGEGEAEEASGEEEDPRAVLADAHQHDGEEAADLAGDFVIY